MKIRLSTFTFNHIRPMPVTKATIEIGNQTVELINSSPFRVNISSWLKALSSEEIFFLKSICVDGWIELDKVYMLNDRIVDYYRRIWLCENAAKFGTLLYALVNTEIAPMCSAPSVCEEDCDDDDCDDDDCDDDDCDDEGDAECKDDDKILEGDACRCRIVDTFVQGNIVIDIVNADGDIMVSLESLIQSLGFRSRRFDAGVLRRVYFADNCKLLHLISVASLKQILCSELSKQKFAPFGTRSAPRRLLYLGLVRNAKLSWSKPTTEFG